MNFETTIYGLLLILVGINAFVFFAETYIVVGITPSGTPINFSFDNQSLDTSYGYEDLNTLHQQTKPDLSNLVQDEAPDNIWAILSSGFASFWAILQEFFNLAFGFSRLTTALFEPINTSTTCGVLPTEIGCAGTGLARLVDTILLIPIIFGIIHFIKLILQTVGLSN
jgi:hypothetical protein